MSDDSRWDRRISRDANTTITTNKETAMTTKNDDSHGKFDTDAVLEAYHARNDAKLLKLDAKQPPALFAKPLYRMRLVHPDKTMYGYHLIDVIAILPPAQDPDSKFPFPHLVCLALLSDGGWTDLSIVFAAEHCDLEDAYEVVS
jgi:hypothetical protein